MTLGDFTEPSLLVPQLECATKETAIAELSKRLASAGRVDSADAFLRAVLDHDTIAPAVFDGVAIALARGQAVKELTFVFGLSPRGIHWGVANVPSVHAVFLFAVPRSASETYLSVALSLSSFIRDRTAFLALRSCTQPEHIFGALNSVRIERHPTHATRGDSALTD